MTDHESRNLAYMRNEVQAVLGGYVVMSFGGTTIYRHEPHELPQDEAASPRDPEPESELFCLIN